MEQISCSFPGRSFPETLCTRSSPWQRHSNVEKERLWLRDSASVALGIRMVLRNKQRLQVDKTWRQVSSQKYRSILDLLGKKAGHGVYGSYGSYGIACFERLPRSLQYTGMIGLWVFPIWNHWTNTLLTSIDYSPSIPHPSFIPGFWINPQHGSWPGWPLRLAPAANIPAAHWKSTGSRPPWARALEGWENTWKHLTVA